MPGQSAPRTPLIALLFSLLLWPDGIAGELRQGRWSRIVPSSTVTLRDARDISLSPEGILYIADTGRHRVVAVDSSGSLVAETGGMGTQHGQFRWPRSVMAEAGNAVWVLDYGNRRIEKFTRSLEYQGTVVIADGAGDEAQLEAFAGGPQGDLFAFDRDGGRIVRLDPLFNVQSEFGRGTGSQFISDVVDMVFIPTKGIAWWERGRDAVRCADALLNPLPARRLPPAAKDLRLAVRDTCLIIGTTGKIWSQCTDKLSVVMVDSAALRETGLSRLDGLAVGSSGALYMLDGSSGSVWRMTLSAEE